eukprot:CAMPEP_0183828346 /NCGR_PEP_ID=MMETSP0807_2-20130328/2739_1 /TAXON_ID=88271 /ORGANISM="Picocystis salinarum, Strain CCMP1897" /LENGTH=158 /DNA_ID=CAMNT_0026073535 /DNA_START=136 /DNA_END=608 /DNA_ORIENTATION=+
MSVTDWCQAAFTWIAIHSEPWVPDIRSNVRVIFLPNLIQKASSHVPLSRELAVFFQSRTLHRGSGVLLSSWFLAQRTYAGFEPPISRIVLGIVHGVSQLGHLLFAFPESVEGERHCTQRHPAQHAQQDLPLIRNHAHHRRGRLLEAVRPRAASATRTR